MKHYKITVRNISKEQPNITVEMWLPDGQKISIHCSNHGTTLEINPTSKTKRPSRWTILIKLLKIVHILYIIWNIVSGFFG